MPRDAHPMDVVRTCVSLMSLEDKDTRSNSPEAYLIKIDTTLSEASERTITMRIERADYVSDAIKRIVDI